MDEKVFGLLEKMYGEMQNGFNGVREEFKEVREEIKGIKEEVKEVREEIKEVRHDVVRLENKMDNHLKALYDGYQQNTEKLCEVEAKISELSSKVERQEVEIRVIKGGK